MKKWLVTILSLMFAVCLCLGLSACVFTDEYGNVVGPGYSGGSSSSGGSGSSGGSSGGSSAPKEDNDGTFIYSGASIKAANTSISGDIVIPASHNGAPIDTIPASAFKGCNGITSITVPESITSIGEGAFNGCSLLRSITLPFVGSQKGNTGKSACFGYIFGTNSYQGGTEVSQHYGSGVVASFYIPSTLRTVIITNETTIGQCAFANCSMLTEINLNDGILQVGASSFSKCSKIEKINLPSITIIPTSLFYGCISLSSFTINDSVDTIGESAFMDCSALSSVNSDTVGEFVIPSNVTSIGEGAFSGCSMIRSITLPFVGSGKGNTGRAACFGYIFGDDQYQGGTKVSQHYGSGVVASFYIPSILRSVAITNETTIGKCAFENCSMIETLKINSGAQGNVGTDAFKGTATPTWF